MAMGTSNLLLPLCIILCIQFNIAVRLLDDSELYISPCNIYYDTRNPLDNGPSGYSCATMPCDCTSNNVLRNNLLDESQSMELSDHSWIDFTFNTNPTTFKVDDFVFEWQNVNATFDPDSTYISFFDVNTNEWINQTWKYDDSSAAADIILDDFFYLHVIDQIHFHLEWNLNTTSGKVYPKGWTIYVTDASRTPTQSPTKNPSRNPTTSPTNYPTSDPTAIPTVNPTYAPTRLPTKAPTYKSVIRQTKRIIGVDSTEFHSDNIIPLSDRGITYDQYVLPDLIKTDGTTKPGEERAYCLTCILAWADIDASIELEGCPETEWNYTDVNPDHNNSIYHCDTGTWILQTSGRLADWQDTYGRVEIWEVDSRGIKWLHYSLEFDWQNSTCFFVNDDADTGETETIECDVLPLTGSTQYAAYFEFTMPKHWGDARDAPLIAVWYDLLSIPYSIRPELNYSYTNLTFSELETGANFGLEDAISTFQPALVAVGILLACFVAVMLLSCFVSGEKKTKKDFMIDTRNLKTTFRHTPETIIVPPHHIQNRARFSCARHGPWLLVVLVARLMYMFIFTFTFFYLVFQAINDSHYDTLKQWDQFSVERDSQLVALSSEIEVHYSNQTSRMEREVEFRQAWCYDAYLNLTLMRYVEGLKTQTEYHTDQMNNPGQINVNFSQFKNIFVLGDGETACNPDGGVVWLNSKTVQISYEELVVATVEYLNATSNTTYTVQEETYNTTILDGSEYDTRWANFSQVESVIGPLCEGETWCYGWGFTNRILNGSDEAYYIMFNELADPETLEGVSGVCYGGTKLDEELSFLQFNATELINYADLLEAQYIDDFQSYTADLYDTVQGLWSALQDFPESFAGDTGMGHFTYNMNKDYNYSASEYGIDISYDDLVAGGSDKNGTLQFAAFFNLDVLCPDCPQGDFTELTLNNITQFLFNESSITDYMNDSLPVNVSNLISINTAFIEFPDLPTIELPFDFNFPIDWTLIVNLSITLDLVLFIYRWYRTTGIVARIVRGKDIDVSLSYLMVSQSEQQCCYGRSILDYCLNCVIFCHDKLFRMSYNLFKLFYWVWWLLKIGIVALLIIMLYYLMDQILTVDFVTSIGTFQLMTVGLGAQRSVRNQVICTTSLGYNNYTLTNIDQSIKDYAGERNEDAWEHNIDELARVDEWNALFCRGWAAYQTTARDVTTESPDNVWVDLNDSGTDAQIKDEAMNVHMGTYYTYNVAGIDDARNLFDGDSSTYWRPYSNSSSAPSGQDVVFDFYLSPIYMTDEILVGWDIVQITLNWRFEYDATNVPVSDVTPIVYEVYLQDSDGDGFTQITGDSSNHTYAPQVAGTPNTRQDASSFVQYVTISNEVDTRRVRLVFVNVDLWGTEYYLNDVTIAGHAPESQVECPQVDFRFWEFDASSTNNDNVSWPTWSLIEETNVMDDSHGTYIEYCPAMTPVHGLMYRGFVRTWLNEQLIENHTPFILALRNIALSPFFIAIGLVGLLMGAYLFAFIMEWFLMKLDLYRENPYARVPLVTNNYEKYDAGMHETGELGTIYGLASVDKDYYNPTTEKAEEPDNDGKQQSLLADGHVDREAVEMGMTGDPRNSVKGHKGKGGRTHTRSSSRDD